jgi:hypothetical protein
MAMVPKYTSRASVPGGTGMQAIPLSLATSPLSGAGEGLTQVATALDAAATRIQNREDIISSAIANDQFEQDTLKSYNSALEAGNILDPKTNTIGRFNAENEQRVMLAVNNFGGSASAKAQLEASLRGRAGQYANQMIQHQNTEQRKYITGLAQSEIAPIAAMVASDPKALRSSFDQVGVIVSKYADALDPDSERRVREAGQSLVMEMGVSGLLNRGAWKEAHSLLLNNPILMRYLDPSKKEQFDRQIANFAQAENKTLVEMAGREATVNRLIASGVKIDPSKAMNFVVGADLLPSDGPGEKIAKSLAALGIKPEDATVEQKAAILGIVLPKTEKPDPNKDFKTVEVAGGSTSKLTESGAFKRTKPYIESAVDMSTKISTVQSSYEEYKSGNELAGLAVLQTYLKMIDEGAVVRDSDIALAERASPIYETIKAAVSRYGKEGAQAVTGTVIEQAKAAADAFGQKALEMSKGFFDGYEKDTGYSRGILGLPGNRYEVIFNGVRTVPVPAAAAAAAPPPAATAAGAPPPAAAPAGAPEYVLDPITGKVVRKQ